MTGVEHVNLSVRYVPAIGLRLREVEREVILPPDHQQARLLLAHPGLPLRVGVYIGSIVVEQVALNVGLAGLVEKGKFIGPEIRVIAFQRSDRCRHGASALSAATGDWCEACFRGSRDRPKRPAAAANSPPGLGCAPQRPGR